MKFRALNFDYHAEATLRLLEDSENDSYPVIHILSAIEKDENDEIIETARRKSNTPFFCQRNERASTGQSHGGDCFAFKHLEALNDKIDEQRAQVSTSWTV